MINSSNNNFIFKNRSAIFQSIKNEPTFSPVRMPDENQNYVVVDKNKVDFYLKQREYAIPKLQKKLENSTEEKDITENLYIIDQLLDNGVKGVDKMYPTLAKFNNTKSPNVQTFLAGIYRKTQVPDAFGPLCKMLIQNSINSPNEPQYFDPNEEIGGAILSYLA